MSKIYLQNTLTGNKEEFKPIKEGFVSMYNCGPTVYDYAHIGNLRAYVFADTLRRMFEYNGLSVNQVINVTDIGHLSSDNDDGEDKMLKGLKRENLEFTKENMRKVADKYFNAFKDDLLSLNIETPEHFPFASDHIKEDIELIQKLIDKGYTYNLYDGIYFDTKKYPDYGKLGNIKSGDNDHSRIGVNPNKNSSRDFALWKFGKDLGYDAPFGKGFPGWHIECSAMSVKYLGPEFDIHTGGIDHIPVHHNNEIAQSVCAGDPYAHYWMHNAHLNIATENGEDKMAKSGGNFITLNTLREKKIDPLALRYVFLGARYSSPLTFSWETLEGAQTALNRIRQKVSKLPEGGDVAETDFLKFINDDLDTPKALALISEVLNSESISDADKKETILTMDSVLGLELGRVTNIVIPDEVLKLMQERDVARAEKDFAKSDELRNEIERHGFKVKDTESGTQLDLTL